jgi:hypothetical protein
MGVRRPALLIGLAAAALSCAALGAGCGSGGGATASIRPWEADVPYLPPREPSRQARAAGQGTAASAAKPGADTAADDRQPASGAPSDAEVAAELRQAFKGQGKGGDIVDSATLTPADLATVPPTAPAKVARIIQAGNQVARRPYVYGGGHGGGPEGLFVDSAYDCSGSVSFALAAAGLIRSPMDSSSLARFGKPGPGKWVTIYANAGHAFMVVAGLRFDTVGRATHGSRWQATTRGVGGFTVRHPPGL